MAAPWPPAPQFRSNGRRGAPIEEGRFHGAWIVKTAQLALWFIETRLDRPLTLEQIAQACGVSRFHLLNAFSSATGRPVMAYVRARRLSDAARALAAGAPDILSVALECGYSSHEAFTRAFREAFGRTPEQIRAQGDLSDLHLQEPLRMADTSAINLAPPEIRDPGALALVGLCERYGSGPGPGIPAQWMRFGPHIGHVPGQQGDETYGVIFNIDEQDGYDYMCAVAVAPGAETPADLTRLDVAATRYAAFRHEGHVSAISSTMAAIWNGGLSAAGLKPRRAPVFEFYGPDFDPRTGLGQVEIWIPIES